MKSKKKDFSIEYILEKQDKCIRSRWENRRHTQKGSSVVMTQVFMVHCVSNSQWFALTFVWCWPIDKTTLQLPQKKAKVKYQPNYLMAMFCMYLYTSENPKIGKLDFDMILFLDFGTGYSLNYYLDFSQTLWNFQCK